MSDYYVMCGEDRLPFSREALEACGLESGARVEDIEVLEKLLKAERASLEASHAVYRAKLASMLGGKS